MQSIERYYKLGFSFIPVEPQTKFPAEIDGVRMGVTSATRDVKTINEWLKEGFWLGIAGGKIEGSDKFLVILDVDVKNGKDGLLTISDMQEQWGQLPSTLTVNTPSGGKHYYFASKEQIGSSTDVFRKLYGEPKAVDVKGYHGYCVAPLAAGYEEISKSEVPLADLPNDWVMALKAIVGVRTKQKGFGEVFSIIPNEKEVTAFNENVPIREMLLQVGYKQIGPSSFQHPFNATSPCNTIILPNESITKHGSKELSYHFGANDKVPCGIHDSFDVFRHTQCDGDWDRAICTLVCQRDNPVGNKIFGRTSELEKTVRQEMIEGHWRVNDVVMIGGPSEAYKTFYICDAAFSAATGIPFLGRYAVRKCQSLLVLTESQGDYYDRREAWVRDRAKQFDRNPQELRQQLEDVFYYFSPLLITSQNSMNIFNTFTKQYGKAFDPKVWYFDHFSSNYGGKDENNNAEVAIYLSALRLKAHKENTTMIVVHHPTKQGVALRGAACLFNNVPVIYNFEIAENKDRVVRRTKCSYSAAIEPYKLEKCVGDLYPDEGAIKPTLRTGLTITAVDCEDQIVLDCSKLLDDIGDNDEVSVKDVETMLSVGQSTARRYLDKCVIDGELVKTKNGKTYLWSKPTIDNDDK